MRLLTLSFFSNLGFAKIDNINTFLLQFRKFEACRVLPIENKMESVWADKFFRDRLLVWCEQRNLWTDWYFKNFCNVLNMYGFGLRNQDFWFLGSRICGISTLFVSFFFFGITWKLKPFYYKVNQNKISVKVLFCCHLALNKVILQ